MKKKILVLGMVMAFALTGLTACGGSDDTSDTTEAAADAGEEVTTEAATEEATEAAMETETYTLVNSNGGEMTFEWPKDAKYEVEIDANSAYIHDTENNSKVKVYLYHDYWNSLIKEESAFGGDHHDYSAITINGRDGYEVYDGENEYECTFPVCDAVDNQIYACYINVQKSPIMDEGAVFEVKDFLKSDTFKHLIDTVTLTKE